MALYTAVILKLQVEKNLKFLMTRNNRDKILTEATSPECRPCMSDFCPRLVRLAPYGTNP